jgi:ADP-ribosyl-[dinitrogen reductase] hydrolase
MRTSHETQNKALGAFIGLAVGDAVGTTLEFQARDSYEPLTDMVGGGPFLLSAGTWTDDTSMALALAESLIACDGLDADDLMKRFVAWWRNVDYSPTGECFDIGITTRNALVHFEETGDPIAGSCDPQSAGNGSLMRLAPIALYGLRAGVSEMRRTARLQSETTHGARQCLDACEAWALVLHHVINGAHFDEALAGAEQLDLHEPVKGIIAGAWRNKSRDEIRSSGYVAHSLEAALWCNANGSDFRTVILLAANLGEDADTTAAIAGQLAGARFGIEGIPPEWIAKLAWRERLEKAARALIAIT